MGGIFSHTFILRAVFCGTLVSLCAALLGVSLVLKRYSMIGDGLSHVGFGALSVAIAFNAAPLLISTPVVIAAAFLLLKISENSKIRGDAAIALISTSSLAAGVIVTSLAGGMNTDVDSLMFGSVLAMSQADVYISAALAIMVIVVFVVFYNITVFQPCFHAPSIRTKREPVVTTNSPKIQKCLCTGCRTHRGAQHDYNNIHQRIGGCLCKLFYHTTFPEQIAQHQHSYQRCSLGKNQTHNNCYNDREQNCL